MSWRHNLTNIEYLGENHYTCHVFVQMSCVDLGADKDEDMWKTVYFSRVVRDDSDVWFKFMVANNILYLCVRSNYKCVEC